MNRRATLKNLMLSSGAVVALPAWASGWTLEDVRSHTGSFLNGQEELLSSVVDTILPAGEDGVGGMSVGVDQFLIKLLDRCYETDVQENVRTQLTSLESRARSVHGRSFIDCVNTQRESLLLLWATSEVEAEKGFFDLIKSESIRGFRTSRQVMIKYYKYRVAPGHYHGCVDAEIQ
jgi:hypothetical protein